VVVPAFWLFIVSIVLVYYGASVGPFESFHIVDAILQIVVASVVIVLWCVWSTRLLFLVGNKRLNFLWLLAIAIPALSLFYLVLCPYGYLYDMIHHMR
jgi:hypothetical protein